MTEDSHLFSLPVELIQKHILPYLKWNDLLRLRRVCISGKLHSDSYIRDHGGIPSSVEVELDSSLRSVSQFLKLGFPASNFFVNNARLGGAFFDEPHFYDFVHLYCEKIVSLRVHNISFNFMEADKGERYFYECLRNLIRFEILYIGKAEVEPVAKQATDSYVDLIQAPPQTLQNVKYLKLSPKYWGKDVRNIDIDSFNMKFTEFLSQIEYLSPGLTLTDYIVRSQFNLLPLQFTNLTRQLRNGEVSGNLKYFDLKNHLNIGSKVVSRPASSTFVSLCHELALRKVKVRNVPAKLFKTFIPEVHDPEAASGVIESLIGLHPNILTKDLANLTGLQITTWLQRSVLAKDGPDLGQFRTNWPQLQNLSLHVNTFNLSMCIRDGQIFHEMPVSDLFRLVFGMGRPRAKMEAFTISYSSRMWDTLLTDSTTFPCPKAIDIVSSFPNLRILQITNWPSGNCLDFGKLWTELRYLEDVILTRCQGLRDDDFIGPEEASPVFAKLKNLKKLSLLELDKMPGVTDKTFELVVSHLELCSLTLGSENPLENITPTGIRSLLQGAFATTIEIFPFHGWSLRNVDKRQFIKLSNEFRSADMN